MLTKSLIKINGRAFGYSTREIKALEMELNRKINMLRLRTEKKIFNYE